MSYSNPALLTGYRIKIIRQNASPILHALEDGRSVFVGRGESCGIQIKGERVAEIHCLIDVDGDAISIQDWASEAGTKLNDIEIDEKTPMHSGDVIAVGSVRLELIGNPAKPAKNEIASPPPPVAEETVEESVGMETLGYDETDASATSAMEPQLIVRSATERLSDSFGGRVRAIDSFEPTDEAPAETLGRENSDSANVDESSGSIAPEADTAADTEVYAIAHESIGIDDGRIDDGLPEAPSAEDLDWDMSILDDDQIDAEIVELLKSEIEDLRIQLAERDEQLASMEGGTTFDGQPTPAPKGTTEDFAGVDLVDRVDELLAELGEHDERVATLQEVLQTAEIQNQAEREERNCLENWVGEIEQRISERESEWQAEQDALRSRLDQASADRDRLQQQLHAAAQRYGKASVGDAIADETLEQLQKQNSELQTALEDGKKQIASLSRQIERLQTEEPESMQIERAELAKEKAAVSRMRFQLSKQLQDIEDVPDVKDQPDREFAYKLKALREHLREIHEEEKCEREQKGDSLFGRISNLWKRVDDEF